MTIIRIGTFGLACWIASWGASGRAAVESWSTYLGDAGRSGSSSASLPDGLQLQWEYAAPAAPETAWTSAEGRVIERKVIGNRMDFDTVLNVAVADGKVYFGSSVDHHVYCLEASTGRIVWTYGVGAPVRLAPSVWDGRVYFGCDDGYAYCVTAEQGELVWKYRAAPHDEWLLARGQMISRWPVRTGVLVFDGVAYFGAGIFPHDDVFVVALDAKTGGVIWTRNDISQAEAGRDDLTPQGYLLANEEILVVPSGRSLPAVFERATGRLLYKEYLSWRREGGGAIGGTRVHLFHDQILASGPHHYVALRQLTGDVGYGWFPGRQFATAGDDAYTLDGMSLRRFNVDRYAKASRLNYRLEAAGDELQKMLQDEGSQRNLGSSLKSFESQRDELLHDAVAWKSDCPHDSALLVAGQRVVVGGEGQVATFDTASGAMTWQTTVDGDARGLAVADGRLLVSTTSGKILAFADALPQTTTTLTAAEPTRPKQSSSDATSPMGAAVREMATFANLRQGFVLVVGLTDGSLLVELARQTPLHVYAVDDDPAKVATLRASLRQQGLYGHRISVHAYSFDKIPFSNYFANLIVSERNLHDGHTDLITSALARFLKPYGGTIVLRGESTECRDAMARLSLDSELTAGELTTGSVDRWTWATRQSLPDTEGWSHQYGNAGNTGAIADRRIKGGLGVLWYGDPGPGKMVNRHDGAVGPVCVGGRFFIQGERSLLAYDAFNGTFLWERDNPEAIRTGVFNNVNPGNLAANDQRVFVMMPDACIELSAETGELVRSHPLPVSHDAKTYEWGYVGFDNGVLVGTATVRKDVEERLRRRGRVTDDATDAIFGIDLESGRPLWQYAGQNISHHTIALSEKSVFFIDSSVSSEERNRILREDKSKLEKLSGAAREIAEQRLKSQDVRMAVALDLRTGATLWNRPVDVTDCSDIGIGGGKLTLMHRDGVLLLCGANANGHYWKQFVAGEFKRRRMVALQAESGSVLWAKDANYRHRPIVIGEKIMGEPWMFDLRSGEQLTRSHPVTGEQVPWSMMRTGHHCGMVTATDNMLLFRSGFTAFFDMQKDTGVQHFAGHRLGCWVNAIPADGLVIIPEASAGCVCQFSIASTVVLEPRVARRDWAIASGVGSTTPVKHLQINFGAPGDRKDDRGAFWISYPRNLPYKETSLELELGMRVDCVGEPEYVHCNDEFTAIVGADPNWIYTSAITNLRRLEIPLLGEADAPAQYRVVLHWADPLGNAADVGGFDVRAQGQTMLVDFNMLRDAPGPKKAVWRELGPVTVSKNLVLEFVPSPTGGDHGAFLNAIEIERVSN